MATNNTSVPGINYYDITAGNQQTTLVVNNNDGSYNNSANINNAANQVTLVTDGGGALPQNQPQNTPVTIPGCVLWLRADLGITLNGSGVSQWNDQSGKGNNFTQSTTNNQPVYIPNDPSNNNQPSLTFNGTSSVMSSATSVATNTSNWTQFIVLRQNSPAGNSFIFSTGQTNGWGFDVSGAAQRNVLWSGVGGQPFGNITPNWEIWCNYDTNGVNTTCQVNGVPISSGGNITPSAGSGGSVIGAYNAGASNWWSGYVAEVIIYNQTLTLAQINQITSYLQQRYVAQTNVVSTTSNINTNVAPQNPYSPANLNPSVWLRSDYGITLNGNTVSQWSDLSGNGNDFIQTNTSLQPTYSLSDVGFNGAPSVSFNANNSQVMTSSLTTITQPFTVVIVGKNILNGNNQAFFGFGAAGFFGNEQGSGYGLGIYSGNLLVSNNSTLTASIMLGTYNGSNGAIYQNDPNNLIVSGSVGTGNITTANAMSIGNNPPSSNYFNGSMVELLVFPYLLSQKQRQTLFAYLGARYNIPVTTPITGPQALQGPQGITGLYMYVTSEVGVSGIASATGTTVSAWADQSGNRNSFSQATGILQPTFKTNAINGYPAIYFPTGTILASNTDPTATGFTIAAVVGNIVPTNNYQGIYGNSAGFLYGNAPGNTYWGFYANLPESSGYVITGTGIYNIIISTVVNATGAINLYQNGFSGASAVGNATFPNNAGALGNTFGSPTTQYLNGNIVAVAEYTTILTTQQIQQLTQYWGQKYGIGVKSQ